MWIAASRFATLAVLAMTRSGNDVIASEAKQSNNWKYKKKLKYATNR